MPNNKLTYSQKSVDSFRGYKTVRRNKESLFRLIQKNRSFFQWSTNSSLVSHVLLRTMISPQSKIYSPSQFRRS